MWRYSKASMPGGVRRRLPMVGCGKPQSAGRQAGLFVSRRTAGLRYRRLNHKNKKIVDKPVAPSDLGVFDGKNPKQHTAGQHECAGIRKEGVKHGSGF